MAKKKSENKRNIWKAISIIFITLFVLILIGGLIKLYHFKYDTNIRQISEEQISAAKLVVLNELTGRGINASESDIQVSNRIRMFPKKEMHKQLVEASISIGNEKNIYLIDSQTNEILMHMQTAFYGWMNDSNIFPKEPMNPREDGRDVRRPSWR